MTSCPAPRDYSQKVWCFQCGNEYFPEVTECIECGVATTTAKPPNITVLGNPEEDYHLAYDFHEWTAESRSMIEARLSGAKIIHIWQGASLMVREDDESIVDEFIGEVDLLSRPVLDPTLEKTVYELAELTDSEVTNLTQELEEARTPHQINEEGDLVIESRDEAGVEAIFDRLEERAKLDIYRTESTRESGVEIPSLLSDLHRFASRLEMSVPLVPADIAEARRILDLLPQLNLPFGFSFGDWEKLLDRAALVEELLEDDSSKIISLELQEAAVHLKESLPIAG